MRHRVECQVGREILIQWRRRGVCDPILWFVCIALLVRLFRGIRGREAQRIDTVLFVSIAVLYWMRERLCARWDVLDGATGRQNSDSRIGRASRRR